MEGLAIGENAALEDTVCELVAVYNLLENVESGSSYQSVLRETIHDGCQWVSYKQFSYHPYCPKVEYNPSSFV